MAKIHDILELAEFEAKEVSGSPQDWMRYLDTASRLYRYPFSDTLLIHAQRPDSSACAELETWNEKMFRWVNRGAKGIALIDDTGPRRRLRYVFDISDTHMVRGGRTPYLWNLRETQRDMLLDHLADTYGLMGTDAADLPSALLAISGQLAEESLEEAMDGLEYELEDTFLEGLDADTLRVEFRQLLTNSTFYSLSRRCGLEPMEYLEEEDFAGITDFNSLSVLTFLGNATSQLVEPVLRDIGRTVRQAELEEWKENSRKEVEKSIEKKEETSYNEFSTLIRESKENEVKEGGKENATELSSQRGLSVSELDHRERGERNNREIWDAPEDVPERTQEELVSEHDAVGETGQPSGTDRESGAGEDGNSDGWAAYRISGPGQGTGSDEVDGAYEQPDGDGGRNRTEGIGIQLSVETAEQDLSEAEEAEASALSLPVLPTAKEQIRSIEERQVALYAGEIAISPDVVDEVLRKGGNQSRSHLRIIYNFMIEQTPEEYTDFVRREYGEGGIGLMIGGKEYSVWYDELGMQIAVGHTVHDRILDKAFLSWEDVTGRIHQLLRQGEYAPQVVLDAARENAVKEHAQTLAYMHSDMAEGVAEIVFGEENKFGYVYPEKTDRIEVLIAQPEKLADLNERLEGLAEAYAEDKTLMRFHYYRPDRVAAQFRKFAKEAVPYQARDGFEWQEHDIFITQDEIDAYLAGSGPYSDGRLATYAFFIQDKTDREKANFIKERYGTGGGSHALSGADDSQSDYGGKGLRLWRGSYSEPKTEVRLKWNQVAKRIQYLIENDRYLKAADFSRMPEYERKVMANRIISFYSRLPDEIERPFESDFFHEHARKTLPEQLENPETAENLVAQMDTALAALPLDFEDYEKRVQILSEIHQYVEGTYTIFPEQKKEIAVGGNGRQLSLFDFMGMEPEPSVKTEKPEQKPAKMEKTGKDEKGGTSEPDRGEEPLDGWMDAEGAEVPFEVESNSADREIVARFQSVSDMTEGFIENIAILRYLNGNFYNHYNYKENEGWGTASAGPFETLEDARQAVLAHRPDAQGVESFTIQEPIQVPGTEQGIPEPEQEEPDLAFYEEVDGQVTEAMEKARTSFDEFSPEQMDVIYASAEKGVDITPILNPEFPPEQMQLISDALERLAAEERIAHGNEVEGLTSHVMNPEEINAARKERRLPLEPMDTAAGETPEQQIERQRTEPSAGKGQEGKKAKRINFRITDDDLGAGGPKQKFRANMEAVRLLHELESDGRMATPEEQEVLSRYVGWGGLPQAFEEGNPAWSDEFTQLYTELSPEEYRAARESTLNAFYTSPTVIKAMYEALQNMGLKSGNVLEPSCGIGNFMGLVPEEMEGLTMYGVELDRLSGRIAKQLYQKNTIAIQGFEATDYPESFFDCVIGNVPFGAYKVADRKYDRFNFMIHDYFIAKSLDLVRPGGVVAVVTSSGTMDKQNPGVRKYIASRAELLGAIRLPNNAFQRNANTNVVADILFLQKRDRAVLEMPEWVGLGNTPEGYSVNSYFMNHPEMVLGEFTTERTQYGKQEVIVKPVQGAVLSEQLKEAVSHIYGTITEPEIEDSELEETVESIPADPAIKNFSFANVDGQVYYRENSRMNRMELPAMTAERVLGMIALRDVTQKLIQCQMEEGTDAEVAILQNQLNKEYDRFTARYGLVSSTANKRAFSQDSSYCLLCSLEIVDENGKLKRKADIFTKRTIRKPEPVTSVDTASEALAVSIGERAKVDVPFMAQLSGKTEEEVLEELTGVIFKNPLTDQWEMSDEYLSGNVREKLSVAKQFAENYPEYEINVQALMRVQPKDLDASEIEIRLGATWIDPGYIDDFMGEIFKTPKYALGRTINVKYAQVNGQWNISGKNADRGNSLVSATYGTERANGYRLLEDALNLRDTKIYDIVVEDGQEKRVLNKKETMLAQQKQEMIKEAFKEWIFRDIDRREDLCRKYNELFNSTRPREYDGSHIRFVGMTPEITLMQHQKNAVAHILYGHNTLLAHCVGAGKTYQMIAAGMESKRLGLSQKNLYVVPNHLTEQWGSDFLRLYPGANVLVATKKDFEPANRKKFCSRIATGDYDAIIIGHSQFERIPLSRERQIAEIERQIDEITMAMEEAAMEDGSRYTVKQMEKTKKTLKAKLDRLNDQTRKDDVVTFEQLGVDRLFVDESHYYKNLFLYTKMRNIAGIAQTDAQKSSDMFMKCRYLDELTGGRGVTFATGTPVSNSMVELYTIMRYLQYDTLQKMGLGHFDSWASTFGETVTAIEITPEL